MPITRVTITVNAVLPAVTLDPGAIVAFTLSQADTEGGIVVPADTTRVTVAAEGDAPATVDLWPNTAGLRATHYTVDAWVALKYQRLGLVQIDTAATLADLLDAGAKKGVWSPVAVDPVIARRLGAETTLPHVNVVMGQSGSIGVGTGQSLTIDQSGGGQSIYNTFAGGGAGVMVPVAYGTVPLNRKLGGGTSTVGSECYGNLVSNIGNRLRSERLVHPDRPIHHLVVGASGLNISGWIDSPFTWFVAFEAAMAKMSADYGAILQVDTLHFDQVEGNGTTAGPYNTNDTYLGALRTLFAMLKASIYISSETSFTYREVLTSAAYEPSDAPGTLVRPSYNRLMAQRAFATEHPHVAYIAVNDLGSAGTLASDVNHLPGAGLDIAGARIADSFRSQRTGGGNEGGLVSSDGRPLVSYPLITVTNTTRNISVADLRAGHLMVRAANAILNLPLMPEDFQTVIKLDITSVSVSNTVVNSSPGTTIDAPLGFVASVSMPFGGYELSYNGQWHLVDENPRRGNHLPYAAPQLDPNTTKGLIVAEARDSHWQLYAGNLFGLPSPENGARVEMIQRSITTFGASTIGIACNSGVISAGGTGYAVGDTITCALGGASGTAPTFAVTAVAAGVVTAMALTGPGCITSTARPASPAAQASTSGIGTGATITLSYTGATIKGPRITDSAYSYSMGTVGQVVVLKGMGGDWWVLSDNKDGVIEESDVWTPVFGNSVPGSLIISGVTASGKYIKQGSMMWVSCAITFTAALAETASGYWSITGMPAFGSDANWALQCIDSANITLPAGQYTMVGVPAVAASGTVRLRTATNNTDLPIANLVNGASTIKMYGWVPL